MACLDTSTLIDLQRGPRSPHGARSRAALASLLTADEQLTTTIVNVAELQVGIHRARDHARERAAVAHLLSGVQVLPLDGMAAEVFGRIMARLSEAGDSPGDMDVLIAAIAMTNGERLVTRNPRHFRRIMGLKVVTY